MVLSGHIFDHCILRKPAGDFLILLSAWPKVKGDLLTGSENMLRRKASWSGHTPLGAGMISKPGGFQGDC